MATQHRLPNILEQRVHRHVVFAGVLGGERRASVQRRLTFSGVSAEEILPAPGGGNERVNGGRGTKADGFVFSSQNVGSLVSTLGQGFVHLTQERSFGLGVGAKLAAQSFLVGDPRRDGSTRPLNRPLLVAEVLGHTAPQAFVGRRLWAFLRLALTVVLASASTVSPSRHGRGFG